MVKSMCDIEIPKLLKPYQRQKWKKVDKLLKKLWLLIPSCFVQAMQDTDIALATKCISFEEWWWSLYGMLMVLIHKDRQTKKVLDLIHQICKTMKQGE